MTDKTSLSQSTVSRRSVAKGMAWAVPAIAVAGAAPAFAVSGDITVVPNSACKSPGASCSVYNKGYALGFTVTNNTRLPIVIDIDCIKNGLLGGVPTTFTIFATPTWEIAAGASQTILVGIVDQGSSPQTSISGTALFTWFAPSETPAECRYGQVAFGAADTPPCTGGTPASESHCPPNATGTPFTGNVPCSNNPGC